MRILDGGAWRDDFLDPHRHDDEYRVAVNSWLVLAQLDDLYFVRPRSGRLVLNYVREVGPKTVLRKIASRRGERLRNQKLLACGHGVVLERPDGDSGPAIGDAVVFLAPQAPPCPERVVVTAPLVEAAGSAAPAGDDIVTTSATAVALEPALQDLRAWSRHSGVALDPAATQRAMSAVQARLSSEPWTGARRLSAPSASPTIERRPSTGSVLDTRPSAILFGYGNYAKTNLVPNVADALRIDTIHEIDPTQIPTGTTEYAWDTSPHVRDDERHDVFLIAGYHSSHADLAVEAMRRGATAVVEKPLATEFDQLERLLDAIRDGGRLFGCLQRRYLPFNEIALRDLGVDRGQPIDYHCLVYEVPLPAAHWYRWPSARSRLVSNGCHWLDHFLHLNEYAPLHAAEVHVTRSGTVNVSAELETGACFTMVLTDAGSQRTGVQDHVELRANGVTARIVNAMSYSAEDGQRRLRRARCSRSAAYERMYREITRRMLAGDGDSLESVRVSAGATLYLESLLGQRTCTEDVHAIAPLMGGPMQTP